MAAMKLVLRNPKFLRLSNQCILFRSPVYESITKTCLSKTITRQHPF